MLTPRAKAEHYTGTVFSVSSPLSVYCDGAVAEQAFRTLNLLLSGEGPVLLQVKSKEEAQLCLICDLPLENKRERYQIRAEKGRIQAFFGDFPGGRNAAATLVQLFSEAGEGYAFAECEIDDWADAAWRSLLVDTCYHPMEFQELKDHVFRMALSKMNLLHFHFMDNRGYMIESEAFPWLNNPEYGYLSKAQLQELLDYAHSLGISVMPEIEFSTHALHRLEAKPELFKCEPIHGDEPYINWATCIGKEEIYTFYEGLVKEVAELFSFPVIHIGTDEIALYDLELWPMWYNCKHCRKMAEKAGIRIDTREEVAAKKAAGTFREKGIEGTQDLLMAAVKRMHGIVKAAGKRMMMWNDSIDIAKPCNLPRDILIHFWRIAAPFRGPSEGCSMARFLEEGFEVVNSSCFETYVEGDIYKPGIPFGEWAPTVYPVSEENYHPQILGGGPCAWGHGNGEHFHYSLASMLAFYGDRLWNKRPGVYEEAFECSVTRLLLGIHAPSDWNVYAAVGGYRLPRNVADYRKKGQEEFFAYLDRITLSREEVGTVLEKLCVLARKDTPYGRQAKAYLPCVEWALEKME